MTSSQDQLRKLVEGIMEKQGWTKEKALAEAEKVAVLTRVGQVAASAADTYATVFEQHSPLLSLIMPGLSIEYSLGFVLQVGFEMALGDPDTAGEVLEKLQEQRGLLHGKAPFTALTPDLQQKAWDLILHGKKSADEVVASTSQEN